MIIDLSNKRQTLSFIELLRGVRYMSYVAQREMFPERPVEFWEPIFKDQTAEYERLYQMERGIQDV